MRLIAVALLGLLTACGPAGVTAAPHVDVDTPALRSLKAQAGIADCPTTTGPAAKNGLAEVTLPCLGGGRDVELARLKGPMVINLWAQWCGPCRAELPHYQEFSRKYAGRVPVIGVDWNDTQPEQALRLAEESGVTYPLLADTDPVIRGQVLPRVILIDAEGRIAHDEAVEITSVAQLERLVRTHLDIG